MWHGLPGILALIDYEPIAFDSKLFGDRTSRIKQKLVVARVRHFCHARNFCAGNNQQVDRSLRRDISKSNTVLVLIHDFARDFAIDDLGKEGRHTSQDYAKTRRAVEVSPANSPKISMPLASTNLTCCSVRQ